MYRALAGAITQPMFRTAVWPDTGPAAARRVMTSNEDEAFASVVERFVLS